MFLLSFVSKIVGCLLIMKCMRLWAKYVCDSDVFYHSYPISLSAYYWMVKMIHILTSQLCHPRWTDCRGKWKLATMYVARLFERSRELAEDPLRAAQAYENTVLAIHEAEQAARAAMNASAAAFEKVTLWYSVHLTSFYRICWLLFSQRKRGSMFLPALVCVSVCVSVCLSVCDHDN